MSWGLPSPYYESHASHQEAKHTSTNLVVVLVWAGPFICCMCRFKLLLLVVLLLEFQVRLENRSFR